VLAKRYEAASSRAGCIGSAARWRQHAVDQLLAPLDAKQDFATKVHLVDTVKGKVDGAWELSDNQMERLRHLEPQRKLVLTVDKGLLAVNGKQLDSESVTRLETRDMQPTVGFASRGSLLPPAWPKACR
jgi:uncharacterized protein YfaS (alpha-2-macroglobulin family)